MKIRQNDPLRSSDMRQHNQNIILSKIYGARNRGISQSELVNETGLKAPTLFRIFSSLEEQGLIESCSPGDEPEDGTVRKGRRPMSYTVNKDALYTVGLEFWASCISLGIFNFNGSRIFSRVDPLPPDITITEVMDMIAHLVREALDSLDIPREKVPGIGVAAPGQVDVAHGVAIYYPRIRGMQNVNLEAELEKRLNMTVLVHNNCSAMALSEYRYGGYDHGGSLFTFLLRSGVNGSFIDEKGIFITSRYATLETGHIPIDSHGPPCSCGTRGCLQGYLLSLDEKTIARGKPLFSGLEKKLIQGDPAAVKTIQRASDYLFTATKSIMRFFAPRSFLIIGSGEVVSSRISELIHKRCVEEPDPFISEVPKVFSHTYDPLVAQRGASDLVISYYFS